jgi:uncharacterized protein (TIGR02599 family)
MQQVVISALSPRRRNKEAFTLLEVLVACTVLVLLLAMLAAVMQTTTKTVLQASNRLSTYATARSAFDTMNQKLSQATLNTYWDYYNAATPPQRRSAANAATFAPAAYGRASDLQFVVRQNTQNSGYGGEIYFQSPEAFSADSSYQSTRGLLNACGYYVQFCSSAAFSPSIFGANPSYRYRLMQGMEPTESLSIYPNASSDAVSWITTIKNSGLNAPSSSVLPLADNVICAVFWPLLPAGQDTTGNGTALTTDYTYDSQVPITTLSPQPVQSDTLPPTIQVTMVVIDEASATRIDSGATPPSVIQNALAQNGGLFKKASSYASDLGLLQGALNAAHIGFEVLTTTVVLRESKWSP